MSESYGNEVICIKKESLQKIEHINVERTGLPKNIDCNLKLQSQVASLFFIIKHVFQLIKALYILFLDVV